MRQIKVIFILMVTLLLGAATAEAYTYELSQMEGKVGKYAIVMDLSVNPDTGKATGWYYYKSKGPKNKIKLSGKIYGDPVDNEAKVTLTETVNGKTTGSFSGMLWISGAGNQGYEGTWTSPTGKKLKFSVDYFRPGW